jgi:hypothetical protein
MAVSSDELFQDSASRSTDLIPFQKKRGESLNDPHRTKGFAGMKTWKI